jgi:hypothetical protein
VHLMMVAPSLRAAAACALLGLAAAGPKTILQPPGAVGLSNKPSLPGELPVQTPAQARYQSTDFVALM